jgi:hypothetical protein
MVVRRNGPFRKEMGGASGRQYIIEEQLKPRYTTNSSCPFSVTFISVSDVSDIPDGDWQAAKLEVERLRGLISRV